MKKKLLYLIISIFLLFLFYTIWSLLDRKPPNVFSEGCSTEFEEFGINSGQGNIVGIQPKVSPIDFANETNFFNKLDSYLQEAKQANYLTENTVVLFPEYIGTWLVVAGEKEGVYTASSITDAAKLMISSNLGKFLLAYLNAPQVSDKVKYSLFSMKSAEMAEIYHQTFSRLSYKYQVAIVAGSILLSEPMIKDNSLRTTKGNLYNISVVYKADGNPYPEIIRKKFLTSDEQPFTKPSKINELPVFDLPIGRTSVLICADSWYTENYQYLDSQKAEIALVPSFCSSDGKMTEKWKGYDGYPTPEDVEKLDIGTISEQNAWLKYSLSTRSQKTSIKQGMNVFLRGRLWEMGSDGNTIVLKDKETKLSNSINGATIVCLWL
jgi:predicted amidohydrolase